MKHAASIHNGVHLHGMSEAGMGSGLAGVFQAL